MQEVLCSLHGWEPESADCSVSVTSIREYAGKMPHGHTARECCAKPGECQSLYPHTDENRKDTGAAGVTCNHGVTNPDRDHYDLIESER